jgi:hypothetical protein
MMEAADLRKHDRRTIGDRLHRVASTLLSLMTDGFGHVPGKRAPEMRLIEHDHVIETLAE